MKKLYRISIDAHVDDSDMYIILDDEKDNIDLVSCSMSDDFDRMNFNVSFDVSLSEILLEKIDELPIYLKNGDLYNEEFYEDLDRSIEDFFVEFKMVQAEKEYKEKHQQTMF